MSTFVFCVIYEEPWPEVLALTIAGFFVASLGIFIVVFPFTRLGRIRLENWRVNIGRGNWSIVLRGGPVAILLGLFLLVTIPGVVWYAQVRYGDAYEVTVDTGGLTQTLGDIRQFYQGDTASKIVMSDAMKGFDIKGRFDGKCVADLFFSICKKYSSDLTCDSSYYPSTIVIREIQSS